MESQGDRPWPGRRAKLLSILQEPYLQTRVVKSAQKKGHFPSQVDLNTLLDLVVQDEKCSESQTCRNLKLNPLGDFTATCILYKTVTLVRKSVDKKWASKMQGQSSARNERAVLLLAAKDKRRDIPRLFCALQDSDNLYVLLEYAPLGTVWIAMESSPNGRLSEALVRVWTAQAIVALDWLHLAGFVHRDVKPHNMLISAQGHIKLTDFGSSAALFKSGDKLRVRQSDCACVVGTIDYIAAEILLAHQDALERVSDSLDSNPDELSRTVGNSVDWWSLGVVVYEALLGEAPFFAQSIGETYERILSHKTALVLGDADCGASAKLFIKSVLCNFEERADIHQICAAKFFAGLHWNKLETAQIDLDLSKLRQGVETQHSNMHNASNMSNGFNFSAFFSSPGLSALRGDSFRQAQPSGNDWLGFTYLPAADIFDEEVFKEKSEHIQTLDQFKTPRRPSATPAGVGTTARKRRPISDLDAFAEVLDIGLQSVKRRATASPPETQLSILEERRRALVFDIGRIEQRYNQVVPE